MVRPCRIIGGAEIYNFNLVEGFKKFYPEVKLFFISTSDEFSQRIRSLGAEVIQISVFKEEVGTKKSLLRLMVHFPSYLFGYLKTILELRKSKKIHTLCFQSATEKIFLSPFFKVLGFRIIWIEHGPYFRFNISGIIKRLYSISSFFADKIITVSENTREAICLSVSSGKLVCIKTGINSDYYSPLDSRVRIKSRAKMGFGNKEIVVGYSGILCDEKGIIKLLEVGSILGNSHNLIKFMIVGTGLRLNYSKNFVKRKKIDNMFVFTGFKSKVKKYMGMFDVMFYPTNIGSLSMALMEAMAMGIPVITRDVGGNRELVVDGVTGYLFKDETPEELAKMIMDLLNDPKERREMGKAARERIVKYFNQERWIRELYAVFKEVSREE